MVDIDLFCVTFTDLLNKEFGSRIWFVGLQGSYARGEADKNSDIDLVVILDRLSVSDIERYNQLLDGIPERKLMCGFISGKSELLHWNKSELFQFYYDTKPIIGSLDELLFLIEDASIDQAIKEGVCSIYHSCVHNMLYEKSVEILKSLYKSATFVIQAICFKQTGEYLSKKAELIDAVNNKDKSILKEFFNMKAGKEIDFQRMSGMLFNWSKNSIKGE